MMKYTKFSLKTQHTGSGPFAAVHLYGEECYVCIKFGRETDGW